MCLRELYHFFVTAGGVPCDVCFSDTQIEQVDYLPTLFVDQ